ncbi:hypothetical protein JZ751_024182 [Albula glossodonta]|uniref:Chemokine interleukin-8-like domain-containing protein n=1 Tax=Albula glossodonta TaxID=121402 RepID=A0A8T2NIQ5_9TELE|nr:hypothetical protein JZ751_024182 [Albula glossodonta]
MYINVPYCCTEQYLSHSLFSAIPISATNQTTTMSTRVLLLLALSVFMACEEQRHHTYGGSRSYCMCRRVRERYGPVKAIQDIQIYPPVSLKNGLQYCLDHRVKKVQELVQSLQKTRPDPQETRLEGSSLKDNMAPTKPRNPPTDIHTYRRPDPQETRLEGSSLKDRVAPTKPRDPPTDVHTYRRPDPQETRLEGSSLKNSVAPTTPLTLSFFPIITAAHPTAPASTPWEHNTSAEYPTQYTTHTSQPPSPTDQRSQSPDTHSTSSADHSRKSDPTASPEAKRR